MRAELVNRLAAAGLPRSRRSASFATTACRRWPAPRRWSRRSSGATAPSTPASCSTSAATSASRRRGLDRVNVDPRRDGGVQPPERERVARRGDRARRPILAAAERARDGHDQRRLRLPVRRAGRPGAGGGARRAVRRRDEVVLADTIGVAAPRGAANWSSAEQAGRLPRAQHAQHRLRQRARGAGGGRDGARRVGRRPRRLPVRAARERQRRDRGSRLPARARGRRDGSRPRRADRDLDWLEGIFGRKLEGQLYRAATGRAA